MKSTLSRHRRPAFLALGTSALTLALCLWPAGPALAQLGFSISVDGEHVAGDRRPAEQPRATDVDLAAADIQVTYDGLESERRLMAGLIASRPADDGTVRLTFGVDTNYGQWVERAEIRIFEAGSKTPVAILPVSEGAAEWLVPAAVQGELTFVGRVYDRDGRYDETVQRPIALAELRTQGSFGPRILHGGDNTAARDIHVHGGTVTVSGTSVPPGAEVRVLGEVVPVDRSGRFVIDRILPPGDHVVDIALARPGDKTITFKRDINIPDSEWFYVGLADLTVGTRWGSGRVVAARPDEFDTVYYKGRAAFYLKGKIRGEYLLTASADTGAGPLSEMFSGMLASDPQSVLRRIDPDQYYPVYGDDSVLVEDAPTSGKLYVRLERGSSHVLWGNFRTEIGDGSMLYTQRNLYGASAHYESETTTAAGVPHVQATAYLAQPGTLPAREVLRGTGGSAYVLRRQDIVPGSEIVTVDTINAITGTLIESRRLRPGHDYSINYLQGLVILSEPLSSSVSSTGAVRSGQPDHVNLVVKYEYTTLDDSAGDYAFGGSAAAWLGDHLRVGGVALAETNADGEDFTVVGVNARVEADATTFVEAELLRSTGRGHAEWLSVDGGFSFVQQPPSASTGEAHAFRVRAQADLSGMLDDSFSAVAGILVEGRQAGFTTLGRQTPHDTFLVSAYVDAALTEQIGLRLDIDHIENTAGLQRSQAGAELRYALADDLTVTAGLVHRETRRPGGTAADNGGRTDVGARVSYQALEDLTLHAFGQATVQATAGYGRNDRLGLGAEWQFNEEWSVGAEGSLGTTGPQAQLMLSRTGGPGERDYIGLRVAPDVRDEFFVEARPLSGLVAGAERRLNDAASVFAENTYGLFDDEGRLNALYGVSFQPDQVWSASATYETGRIADDLAGDLERHALSGALAYTEAGIKWTTRGEVRLEDSADGSKDRNTFLGQTGLAVQTNDDWRLLAGINALVSQSDQASILDGDYVEATVGAAYRPVDHDRLNALMRYAFLYDLPGPDQVSRNGSVLGPAQRSHIFSIDANYDLTETLTVGAKYGFRIGEVSQSRESEDFTASSAHLAILRADFGIIPDWHVLLEGRVLYQPETESFDAGALAMVSYDLNEAIRLGVGYNFGTFSDDLTDLTHDDGGFMLNLTTRY